MADPGRLNVAMVAACPFPFPRGTPIRIWRLAEAMARRGHRVHVVTYHLGDLCEEPPFALHRIPAVSGYRKTSPGPTYRKILVVDRRLAGELREVLASHPIDLVHGHHYEGLMVALLARRAGTPILYDAHTTLESELPSYGLGLPGSFKRGFGRLLDRKLPRFASHTIAVTDAVREHLIKVRAVIPEKITVISNGVEREIFEVPQEGRWKGEAGTRTIVFSGNTATYQGIDLLLQAFARVRAGRPEARLLIVTRSSLDRYDALARRLQIRDAMIVKDVDFDGLPGFLAGADVAVNPRIDCAGIPQKLLNYMAAGVPVVSFRGAAPVIRHERTGLCVADEDIGAMAAAIERLLSDAVLARRLGEAARRWVRRAHSWDRAAAAVEALYRRVLDGDGAPAGR
jgi:glycosyltransferase involved in cell wall biosynthesis